MTILVIVTIAWIIVVFGIALAKMAAASEEAMYGYLYFIGAEAGPIKVGMTRSTPEERLTALQTGHPAELQVIYAVRVTNPVGAEEQCHALLADDHVGGEWYGRDSVFHLIEQLKSN